MGLEFQRRRKGAAASDSGFLIIMPIDFSCFSDVKIVLQCITSRHPF